MPARRILSQDRRWSTAGDGRQQAHLIALAQHLRGGGVFGVHADRDAAQCGRRLARAQALEQLGDGRAFGQLDRGRRRPASLSTPQRKELARASRLKEYRLSVRRSRRQ